MLELIKKRVEELRIVILGFGMEGQSSLRYFKTSGWNHPISVADQNPDIQNHALIKQYGIETISGSAYLEQLTEKDFIIKSPGIPLYKIRPDLNSHSQTSLFLEKFGSQTIGITGTKGKSTTSTMMYQILQAQKKNALLVGNIGQPAFDLIPKINDDTIIVYELSAHQLQCVDYGPRMAILLNLMPEHLDYFKDVTSYYQSKLNIFRSQSSDAFQFISTQAQMLTAEANSSNQAHQTLLNSEGLFLNDRLLMQPTDLKYLIGAHHLDNIQALLELSIYLKLDLDQSCETIRNFQPLPHRQEFLGEKSGVRFVNDSISTIPQSAIQAIKAIGKVDYLILGGLDRGIDYNDLAEYLGNHSFKKVYFLGKAGKSILRELRENEIFMHFRFQWNEKLQDIREELLQIKSGTVLLSPAAASYDAFKNFEERGDYFREIFNEL